MLRNKLLRLAQLMIASATGLNRALGLYYLSTAMFLVLDFGLGINVRLSFLEGHDGWRLLYYCACFGCFGIIVARPGWAVPVTAVESLITMVALILSTATRAMNPDVPGGALSIEEVVNFLLSGFAAYLSWTRSMTALFGNS
jgi:hypothetical protein